MRNIPIRKHLFILSIYASVLVYSPVAHADELTEAFHHSVHRWAVECREEIQTLFQRLLASGQVREGQLFDTFYVPVPNTEPQRYRTQYDVMADEVVRPILDRYLEKDPRLVFVVLIDRNGYLPTHNTRFSQPLTGNPEIDINRYRAKRIAVHRTGLAAARNREPYLLQHYERESGELMYDMSVPVMVNNRHWGAIRVGFKNE